MFSNIRLILPLICALAYGAQSLTYSDLEALGVNCPDRDKCEGYRNNLTYVDRSCECDFACSVFGDCCIDAFRRRNTARIPRSNLTCLHYGEGKHTGVYAISSCSSSFRGSREVRQKCLGPLDFTDPLSAAPVTDSAQGVTYRNLYCAECNNAHLPSLKTFHIRMACQGLHELTDEQIMADIEYNDDLGSWGVYRLDSFGNATNFVGCALLFDVPDYLNGSVRFCRSDLVSQCAHGWIRLAVKRACDEYMAAVYDTTGEGYRNPHCAICNHRTVDEVSCRIEVFSRKRPMSFALLLDVNQVDGDQVGMRRVATPECPSNHKYDPFFKRCRELVCALPGHVVVNGRCVRGG